MKKLRKRAMIVQGALLAVAQELNAKPEGTTPSDLVVTNVLMHLAKVIDHADTHGAFDE